MKLYKVTFDGSAVVLAPSDEHAIMLATKLFANEHLTEENIGVEIDVDEIKTMEDLPDGWDTYSLPFGENEDEKTIETLLEERDSEKKEAKRKELIEAIASLESTLKNLKEQLKDLS